MNRFLLAGIIIFLFIMPVLFYSFFIPIDEETTPLISQDEIIMDPLDGGWIKEQDDVIILYLNGTNYMMGYQYGHFLHEEIEQFYRCITEYFELIGCSYDDLMYYWEEMKDTIPPEYIEEMKGMMNGSHLPWEHIVILNTVPAVLNLYMCSGMSAWGSATTDGSVLHFRSLDATIHIQDKETGTYMQELQAIVLRNPVEGFRSVSFSLIGDIGSWGGFNEKGIAVGENSCKSEDTTLTGMTIAFRMRMVHDYAETMDDAIEILNQNRDCAWNLFVSDGNTKTGVVIEQTANHVYVGEWDDPVESTRPFYPIEDVVRRTNFFIEPTLAATQRDHYNPRGFRGLFRFLFKNDFYFYEWQHYKTFSQLIKREHGELDLETTMDMVRDVYIGKSNLLFRFFQFLGSKQDIQQWVANPKTGDFLIRYASIENCAHENKVHSFNFYDLLSLNQ